MGKYAYDNIRRALIDGYPYRIKGNGGYEATLVAIQPLLDGDYCGIYRYPGGDCCHGLEAIRSWCEVVQQYPWLDVHFHSRGESGNIFRVLGMVRDALLQHRRVMDYNNLRDRVFKASSYDDALAIIREEVDLIDDDGIY